MLLCVNALLSIFPNAALVGYYVPHLTDEFSYTNSVYKRTTTRYTVDKYCAVKNLNKDRTVHIFLFVCTFITRMQPSYVSKKRNVFPSLIILPGVRRARRPVVSELFLFFFQFQLSKFFCCFFSEKVVLGRGRYWTTGQSYKKETLGKPKCGGRLITKLHICISILCVP